MKKVLSILALSAVVLGAKAQTTVQGSRFFDNWSIGVVAGGITPVTPKDDFFKNVRATYGVELGKQFTPSIGMTIQFTAANNTYGFGELYEADGTKKAGKNVFDVTNLSLLTRYNLMNIFGGYKGTPRLFEIEAVAGLGWGRNWYPGDDEDFLSTKFGLNFNFNVGKEKAWTVSLRPSVVNRLEGAHSDEGDAKYYTKERTAFELLVGGVYHFKNKSNGKHYMTLVKAYDQAEVDGLNAKINDLRAQVSDKDAEIANLNASNRDLQQQLNDCRNQKPVVQTVTNNTASMEQTVTFRQGKSTVDASQLPNVERVATFLKNHKEATVSIKGYASPEGSKEINEKIAKARAEAVKTILVNKYKISASRITAEGQGVGNMFSEPDWNRVSICTIDEAK